MVLDEDQSLWHLFLAETCAACVTNRNKQFALDAETRRRVEPYRQYIKESDHVFARHYRASKRVGDVPGVYALRFPLDDGAEAVYIGQSIHMQSRLNVHLLTISRLVLGDVPSPDDLRAFVLANRDRVDLTVGYHYDEDGKAVHAYEMDPLEALMPTYPFLEECGRYISPERPSWPNDNYAAIAAKRGRLLKIDVLERTKNSRAALNKAEAHWQRVYGLRDDVYALWLADTSPYLRGL